MNIIVFDPNELENMNASVLRDKEQLDVWLKDGSLESGEQIYEATLIGIVEQKTEMRIREIKQ